MPATLYNYSVVGDTANSIVNATVLEDEINESTIIIGLQSIVINGDDLNITMKDALSSGDTLTLNGIVAAHTGTGAGVIPGQSENRDPVELPRYRPKTYTSLTDITLTSQTTETELANINLDGQISGIAVNFDRDDVEVIVEVDGTEIFRLALDDLNRATDFNLGTESNGGGGGG